MTHDRPYRKAISSEAAKAELARNAGTQFDPQLVKEYLKTLEDNPDVAVSEADGADATAADSGNTTASSNADGDSRQERTPTSP